MKALTSTHHLPSVGMVRRMWAPELLLCGGSSRVSAEVRGLLCGSPLSWCVLYAEYAKKGCQKPSGCLMGLPPHCHISLPCGLLPMGTKKNSWPRQSPFVSSFYRQLFSSWLAKDLNWHFSSVIKQEIRPPWPLSSILSRGREEICGGYSWRSGSGEGEKGWS